MVCPHSPVMVFVLERDFREICFAVMPGSWHWEEVELVCGQAAWMGRGWMYEERLRENINVFVSHCRAGERMDPGSAQRCVTKGQESTPWQLATWQVLIRYKRKQNSQDCKALEQGKWRPYILGGLRFGWDEALGNLI